MPTQNLIFALPSGNGKNFLVLGTNLLLFGPFSFISPFCPLLSIILSKNKIENIYDGIRPIMLYAAETLTQNEIEWNK